MSRDIDQLTDALRRAYPEITVEQMRVMPSGADEERVWHVRHPAALAEVQVESATGGDAPFLVESDLAPPTVARTVGQAVRLITERMGLEIAP